MPFNGSGTFVRLHNWTSDAANAININAGEMDGEDNGFAAGLSICVTRDGQGKMAADFTPATSATYNLGTNALSWLSLNALSGTIGPNASGSGTSLTLNGATNWQAATFTSTAQFTGGNKLTNANQSVTTTQIMLHGLNAEFVSIAGAAGTDQKCWSNYPDNSGNYNYRIENDALTATYTYDQIARTGNSGTFGSHQVIRTFNHGYGSVTFQSTIANAYQVTINAGAVAGFANGLNIIAGSISADNALLIQNQGQTTNFLQMTGQGATTLATVNSNGLITLTVKGLASNTSPVATFGGAASNFATITDGAGIVNQWGVSTGLAAAQIGATSNHALFLTTNNTARISISNGGAITFNSVATTTTAPAAGGAGGLPATPKGYFSLTIGSYAAEVPYY